MTLRHLGAGSPRKRFTVSRLSARSGAQEAAMLRTNSNGSLGSDAQVGVADDVTGTLS